MALDEVMAEIVVLEKDTEILEDIPPKASKDNLFFVDRRAFNGSEGEVGAVCRSGQNFK